MNTKTHFPRSRFVLNGQAQSYSKLTTGHRASMCLCAAAVAFFQCETKFWPRFLIQISSSEYLEDAFPIRYYINPGSFFFDIEYFWLNNAFIFKISFFSLFWTGSNWFLSLLYSCSMVFFLRLLFFILLSKFLFWPNARHRWRKLIWIKYLIIWSCPN